MKAIHVMDGVRFFAKIPWEKNQLQEKRIKEKINLKMRDIKIEDSYQKIALMLQFVLTIWKFYLDLTTFIFISCWFSVRVTINFAYIFF